MEDSSESGLGGRKRVNLEESKEVAVQPTKDGRDKFEVDRGHGVARALETVLLSAQPEDKAQDMSLVHPPCNYSNHSGSITSCKKNQRTINSSISKGQSRRNYSPTSKIP